MSAPNYTPESVAEKFLICPFDPTHCIEPPKMAFHLTKCKKNVTKQKFLRCPFNGTHIIDEKKMGDHINECKNRIMFEGYKHTIGESDPVIGADLPPPVIENLGEDWETDTDETYKPEKYMEENRGKVLIVPTGAKPSERKAFRQKQRLLFSQANRENKKN